MSLTAQAKNELIESFRTHEGDTGSPEVQIALLTKRIDAIAQGVEMGRPSFLDAHTRKRACEIVETRIGGHCVIVARGEIEVD